jgi:DNA-binding LacI/PurR family transcriptional regulator
MSIVEVAKAAGVTHGTVSRVINHRGGVSPDTERRVREAMKRLGYQPQPREARRGRKAAAQGVQAGCVGLLLVGTSRELLQRPGISSMVAVIEAVLRGHGLGLLLAQADSLGQLPPVVARGKCDGLLCMGESADRLPAAHRDLPVVWVLSSHTRPHRWADHVLPDNEEIGLLAAEFLSGQGHRHVAFFNDQPEHPGFAARGEAFQRAAAARGLACATYVRAAESADVQAVWGLRQSPGSAALVERLASDSPRPSGLFVPTDEQCLRLYPLLIHSGLQPGADMAIVSCDNQEAWLRHLHPRPASIDLNFDLMGQRAVEQLLSRISHPGQRSGTRVLIPPQLIEPPPAP